MRVLPATTSKPHRPTGLSTLNRRVEPTCRGVSLADFLSRQLLISAAAARDLIDFGSVQLDGRLQRNWQKRLAGGENITINWPRGGTRRFYQIDPTRILYQDQFLLAYDKEPGTPSQPVPADAYNNIYAALQRFLGSRSVKPPYVALHHRLDRETSGVMLFALDRSVNRKLSEAFQAHGVIKEYWAWVVGRPAGDRWTATDDIGRSGRRYTTLLEGTGKPATTVFEVLLREAEQTLLRACPKTGRTHQIRLHLAAAGHPVVGDRLYGNTTAPRLHLHAYRLYLSHPTTGEPLFLSAPIPQDWPPSHDLSLLPDPGCAGPGDILP